MPDEYVDYGLCMGIPDEREPHYFLDGKNHLKNSHGLCVDCARRTKEIYEEFLRVERELRNHREYSRL